MLVEFIVVENILVLVILKTMKRTTGIKGKRLRIFVIQFINLNFKGSVLRPTSSREENTIFKVYRFCKLYY